MNLLETLIISDSKNIGADIGTAKDHPTTDWRDTRLLIKVSVDVSNKHLKASAALP